MTDEVHTPTSAGPPLEPGPAAPSGTTTYDAAPGPSGSAMDRPEVQLGLAFAGGFMAAMILKRLVS